MTANGWLQIAFTRSCVLLRHQADGPVPGKGVRRLDGLAPAGRALLYRAAESTRRRTSTGPRTRPRCCSSAPSHAAHLRRAAAAAPAAAQPPALRGRGRPTGVRDGGVVHHEYQLAVVLGRDDDVVLLPDDPARVPQLRLGRGRHRAGRGAGPRASRGAPRAGWATSGPIWCGARSTSSSRSRSCSPWSSCSRA